MRQRPAELIYALDERPPAAELAGLAAQHAMLALVLAWLVDRDVRGAHVYRSIYFTGRCQPLAFKYS